MRAIFLCVATAIALMLTATQGLAQELVPHPDAIGGTSGSHIVASDVFANVPPGQRWRYRLLDGHWWYWTPANHWMWYSDGRGWVEFNANATSPVPYDGYYRAGPPYAAGVAVRAYPGVNVGVGPRIGVDVCGPHGSVRVGRIFVGW